MTCEFMVGVTRFELVTSSVSADSFELFAVFAEALFIRTRS